MTRSGHRCSLLRGAVHLHTIRAISCGRTLEAIPADLHLSWRQKTERLWITGYIMWMPIIPRRVFFSRRVVTAAVDVFFKPYFAGATAAFARKQRRSQ